MGATVVDSGWLTQIPRPFPDEVVNEIKGHEVKLDKGRLGASRALFEERFGKRPFMVEPGEAVDQPHD